MINSITLLGSSSGRNAGDAALLSGIMDSIDAACGKKCRFEIPTIRPEFIRSSYPNHVQPISMLPWHCSVKMLGIPTYSSIMRTELSLIFDAVLFDRSLYNPLFNYLSSLHLMLPRAKKAGKRLGMFNVGCGPVETAAGKRMLRDLAEIMDFITVRDADSLELLNSLGVKGPQILLTADAALNVVGVPNTRAHEIMREIGVDPREEILGININQYLDTWSAEQDASCNGLVVSSSADGSKLTKSGTHKRKKSMGKDRFLSAYAKAINSIAKELGVRILFVCTQHHDVSITKELISRLEPHVRWALLANTTYSHYDIIGVLSQIDLLFGMRLHSMILATANLTPTIGIAYQPKCASYFHSIGMDDYMMYFSDFNADSLTEHLRFGWSKRTCIRKQLEVRIPVLRREALKAGELVGAMNSGESIHRALARFHKEKEVVNSCL